MSPLFVMHNPELVLSRHSGLGHERGTRYKADIKFPYKHVSGLAGLGEHAFITAIGLNQRMFWLKCLGQNSVCSLFLRAEAWRDIFGCFPMSDLGTSLAAHTRYQVIHAAAWMEFSAHLQELVAEGREREALRLWASVVELVHLGSRGNPSPSQGSPRFVGSYALTSRARVVPTVGAASSSHGLAFGTAAACWFKRDLGQPLRGSATMPLRRAWTAWRCSGLLRTSARWTFCPSTWVWPWSGWTPVWSGR